MIGIAVCFCVMLALHLATPYWWWIMVIPLLYGFLAIGKGWESFRTGMISAGLLWLLSSGYLYMTGSELIASRVATSLQLPFPWLMILVTMMVAAISGGISGWAGYSVRSVFLHKYEFKPFSKLLTKQRRS